MRQEPRQQRPEEKQAEASGIKPATPEMGPENANQNPVSVELSEPRRVEGKVRGSDGRLYHYNFLDVKEISVDLTTGKVTGAQVLMADRWNKLLETARFDEELKTFVVDNPAMEVRGPRGAVGWRRPENKE